MSKTILTIIREHVPEYLQDKIVICNLVGSRAWNQHSEDSDFDYVVVYKPDLKDFVLGRVKERVVEIKDDNFDVKLMSLLHLVNHLKRGNVNYYEYVLSPYAEVISPEYNRLKDILLENRNSSILSSTKGLIVSLYNKLYANPLNFSKVRKLLTRYYCFAFNYMAGWEGHKLFRTTVDEFEFLKVPLDEILNSLSEVSLSLPSNIDEEVFTDYLLNVYKLSKERGTNE